MGSQTLEILRQGVWASLTGGWFYDPHQNVFCNAVHLYLWLFLLCSPFVTYLYFPKTTATWALYCLTTGVTVAAVKVVNLALHLMYDEAQIISETSQKQGDSGASKTLRETSDEMGNGGGGGIEMQVMRSGGTMGGSADGGGGADCGGGGDAAGVGAASGGTGSSMGLGHVSSTGIGGGGTSGETNTHSNEISQANSAMSIEFAEQVSTIDLKVDVHRKNSSESSDLSLVGGLIGAKALTATTVITHNADVCQTANHRRSFKTKSKSEEAAGSALHPHRSPISEEDLADYAAGAGGGSVSATPTAATSSAVVDETSDRFVDIDAVIRDRQKKKLRNKLQRQISLDAEKMAFGLARSIDQFSRLQRHRSTESTAENQLRRRAQQMLQQHCPNGFFGPAGSTLSYQQSVPSDLYYIPDDDDEYDDEDDDDDDDDDDEDEDDDEDDDDDGEDEDDEDDSHAKHASHEPTAYHLHHHHHHHHHRHQQKTPMRKDSNSTMSALQLPTSASSASAQRSRRHSNAIGKAAPSGSTTSMQLATSAATVRRIKSAALETCCPQPSVSNLAPHPSSVETIGGSGCQQLRNPQHAILPPPSKSLVRNAHANLFPVSASPVSGCEATAEHHPSIDELPKETGDGDRGNDSSSAKRKSKPDDDNDNNDANDNDDQDDDDDEDDDRDDHACAHAVPNREHHHYHHHHHHHVAQRPQNPTASGNQQRTTGDNHRHSTTSDSEDIDRPHTTHSVSDSDTENNAGSQSPLLDVKSRSASSYYSGSKSTGALGSAVAADRPPPNVVSSSSSASNAADSKPSGVDKSKKRQAAAGSAAFASPEAMDDEDDDDDNADDNVRPMDDLAMVGAVGGALAALAAAGVDDGAVAAAAPNPKSEDSGCPSSDCDQASASSKDMLLTAASTSSPAAVAAGERKWFDFRMDSNNISVDVTTAVDDDRQRRNASTNSVATNTPVASSSRHEPLAVSASSSSSTATNGRNLGAIPKRSKSSSAASSSTAQYMMMLHQHANHPDPTAATLHGQPSGVAEGYPAHWTDTPMHPDSRASSWSSSSRRCSADSSAAIIAGSLAPASSDPPPPIVLDALGRTPVDVLHKTKDGWTLRSSTTGTTPQAASSRGDPPPLIPIYGGAAPRPYVCLPGGAAEDANAQPPALGGGSGGRPRPLQTKLRISARHRPHQSQLPADQQTGAAAAARSRHPHDPIATWDYNLTTTNGISCGTLQLELHGLPDMGARERAALQGRIEAGSGTFTVTGTSGNMQDIMAVQGAAAVGSAMQLTAAGTTTGGTGPGGTAAGGAGVASMGASTMGGLSATGVSSVGADSSVPISLGVDFGEAVFCDYWRHYNLPPEKHTTPRRVYKYPFRWFGRRRDIRVRMDRLQLLALLDRDLGWFQALLGIVLAAAVSALGAAVLRLGVYRDVFAFVFCFVMAGSQYSLLKSVQPDAASPIHGFNKTVAFSRPIYFCMIAGLLIGLHGLSNAGGGSAEAAAASLFGGGSGSSAAAFTVFSVDVWPGDVYAVGESMMALMLLMLPVFFSLGLFPQINTFVMYVLEQLDMHVFGGSAVCSLLSAFLAVLRSLLACSVLYGPAYGGLAEPRGTQHVLYSAFCAVLVAVSYHLSRSASDVSCLWTLIKRSLVLHTDDDEEEAAAAAAGTSEQRSTRLGGGCEESDEEMQRLKSPPRSAKSAEEVRDPQMSGGASEERILIGSPATSQPDVSAGLPPPPSLVISMPASPESVKSTDADGRVIDVRTANSSGTTDDDGTATAGKDTACLEDPLPRKLQQTVNARLKNDALVCIVIAALVFSLHCSTVFTVLQPELARLLVGIVSVLGFVLHYVVPQMRKHLPWLWFAGPMLRAAEHEVFEPRGASQVMWFERAYVYACFVERNVLLPLVFVAALTADGAQMASKWGVPTAAMILVVCGLKGVRNSYSDPASQYLIFVFSVLIFAFDFKTASETLLIDYFVMAIVFKKMCEFMLKLQFIVTYIAPWQITWGSAFHAFAQPFSVPHSAMLFVQAAISAVLSTPLNPFLGSAIFLTSYVRPIKFWERDYNTKRIDHSNTRLSSQLERDLGADDNNLNSIFYEHLTRSLQHSLCGDLLLGRWGNVSQGDCFVLASDYLNCLVHIIELGNGLCTFQMRGLEFRGTYCQQREVEAISEGVQENEGCCCCTPGHLPRMLSVNAMFATRWLAWQVVASKYVLEGYSISDNLAQATLQVFEFRKVLITYYVKSIIYYTIRSPKLDEWLQSPAIQETLRTTLERNFVDLDPIFNHNLDEDFDFRASGITRHSFCSVYMTWIQFCHAQRFAPKSTSTPIPQPDGSGPTAPASPLTTLHMQALAAMSTSTGRATMGSNTTGQTTSGSSNALSTSSADATLSVPHRPVSRSSPRASSSTRTPSPRSHKRRSRSEKSSTASSTASAAAAAAKRQHRHATLLQPCATPPATGADEARRSPPTASSITRDSPLVSLLLCLGLLGRRTLATASHNNSLVTVVELFLHGLHALFKGDFRITSQRDEWVFADMDLLHSVVAPAVKMALKLHQDHFLSPEEFEDPATLFDAIESSTRDLVISHEADPLWRNAVLRGAPNLLALRHVMEDGSDEYRLIRLTKRFLGFRVIKVNRECVRGLWAGQQQELIYLRNRNPERGSIQNAKQALRNIINSSCDQPIGYPIYVSPLTTSYAETNEQLAGVIGGAITLERIHQSVRQLCQRVRKRCREGCSSGSVTLDTEMGGGGGGAMLSASAAAAAATAAAASAMAAAAANDGLVPGGASPYGGNASGTATTSGGALSGGSGAFGTFGPTAYGSQNLGGLGGLGSLGSGTGTRGSTASVGKPASNTALLAGLLSRDAATLPTPPATAASLLPVCCTSMVASERAVKRRSGSGSGGRHSHDRRATLPVPLPSSADPSVCVGGARDCATLGAGVAASRIVGDATSPPPFVSAAAAAAAAASSSLHHHAMHLKSNSFASSSTGHLSGGGGGGGGARSSARHSGGSSSSSSNNTAAPLLAAERKTKSEERHHHLQRSGAAVGAMTTTSFCGYHRADAVEATPAPSATAATPAPRIALHRKVIIVDREEIFDCLDLGRRIDVNWPSEAMRAAGGQSAWHEWQPLEGMVGYVVHYWQPNHPEAAFRSNFNRTLLLVQVGERYVPVGEHGVKEYNTTAAGGATHDRIALATTTATAAAAAPNVMPEKVEEVEAASKDCDASECCDESTMTATTAGEQEAEEAVHDDLTGDDAEDGAQCVPTAIAAAVEAGKAMDADHDAVGGEKTAGGEEQLDDEEEEDSETGDHFVLSSDD